MGRIYTVTYSGTITAAGGDTDLLEVLPASDKPIKLRGVCFSQTSELGDTEEENLRISIIRLAATVTSGTGGSSATPESMDSADAAAGCTCEVNNTGIATSSGATDILYDLAWNIRSSPYDFWFPEAAYCPKAKNGEALIVRQQSTANDDYSGVFTFILEEE